MNGRVILATAVGAAGGSRAASAALVCAGSDADRPGLLIDVGGRVPRPTLVASTAARKLEERLAAHLPEIRAASRGQTCHLALPGDPTAFESIPAALPLVRESVAVVHLPPALFQDALVEPGLDPSGVLLRADLGPDRALAALAVGDLLERGLRVAVLKRPLAWIQARRALFGILPADAPDGLSSALRKRLLAGDGAPSQPCYADLDDAKTEPARTTQQQRRDHASPGRR